MKGLCRVGKLYKAVRLLKRMVDNAMSPDVCLMEGDETGNDSRVSEILVGSPLGDYRLFRKGIELSVAKIGFFPIGSEKRGQLCWRLAIRLPTSLAVPRCKLLYLQFI
ncbi:unnamed protein product [Microthlaspi erraticum]|uniref:Pentatricopeptide repeat-containing protein n=1 Tax=Microthlaspi erraticum TaxID=1685480 RepID=A0A6D2KS99_9BRAS|nr:unnamed protein product [Microthlaspi erraticum]